MAIKTPITGPEDFTRWYERIIATQSSKIVSRETIKTLESYEITLRHWQKAINLVAPNSLDELWHRHIADSAQLMPHLGAAKTVLDLGSGGGFPALVLAILSLSEPDRRFYCVESVGKKCTFLREVVRQTGTNVEIHQCRIENFDHQRTIPSIDCVTARALAPLTDLIVMSAEFLEKGSKALFLKGKTAHDEVAAATSSLIQNKGWQFDIELWSSQTDSFGHIVEVRNLRIH